MAMELKVIDGLYVLELPKAILVLTREQFIDGLRRGKWWKRRQASAPRHTAMQQHAMERRHELG
jgi:hypothetical protein